MNKHKNICIWTVVLIGINFAATLYSNTAQAQGQITLVESQAQLDNSAHLGASCYVSSRLAPNPNYKDPTKQPGELVKAVGRRLLPGLLPAGEDAPAQPKDIDVEEETCRDAKTGQILSVQELASRREAAEALKLKAQQEEDAQAQERAKAARQMQPITKADVERMYREHPEIPHPVGGGLYQMRWYDGRTIVGTMEQLNAASTEHYQRCASFSGDLKLQATEHCDK